MRKTYFSGDYEIRKETGQPTEWLHNGKLVERGGWAGRCKTDKEVEKEPTPFIWDFLKYLASA